MCCWTCAEMFQRPRGVGGGWALCLRSRQRVRLRVSGDHWVLCHRRCRDGGQNGTGGGDHVFRFFLAVMRLLRRPRPQNWGWSENRVTQNHKPDMSVFLGKFFTSDLPDGQRIDGIGWRGGFDFGVVVVLSEACCKILQRKTPWNLDLRIKIHRMIIMNDTWLHGKMLIRFL